MTRFTSEWAVCEGFHRRPVLIRLIQAADAGGQELSPCELVPESAPFLPSMPSRDWRNGQPRCRSAEPCRDEPHRLISRKSLYPAGGSIGLRRLGGSERFHREGPVR